MKPFLSNRSKLLLNDSHVPAVKSFSLNSPNQNSSSQGSSGESFYKDINGSSVASASITKHASVGDFSQTLQNVIIPATFHSCEFISDQVRQHRSSILFEDCVFDNFGFGIIHNEISEVSYEVSSDKYGVVEVFDAPLIAKNSDVYLDNTYFSFTCSNEVLQEAASVSVSLTWNKAFVSGLNYKDKKIWKNNMEANISLIVNDLRKQIQKDPFSVSNTDIKIEVFSDPEKINKICEFDFADCFLSAYSEGYTDSAASQMNLSFKYVDSASKNSIIFA